MPLSRRTTLAGLAGLAAVRSAAAQAGYPNRPIRLIVPYAAGGQADVVARILGEGLSRGAPGDRQEVDGASPSR
jgi:tripartite-type tricarboxylate transporter receptor subunit TctC